MVTSAKTFMTTATTKKRVANQTEYLMFQTSQFDYSVYFPPKTTHRISLALRFKHASVENNFGIAKVNESWEHGLAL